MLSASSLVLPLRAALPIDVKSEYMDGVYPMVDRYGYNDSYYAAWANASGVEMLYLADLSWVTVNWFEGLHFHTVNGSDIFVGNTFAAIEIFNDTDHNGIVDSILNGPQEVEYYLTNFTNRQHYIHPLQKTVQDGVSHYKWGIAYSGLAEAVPSNCSPSCYLTFFNLTNLAFNYDFYVNATQAHLKMSYQITPGESYPQLSGRSLAVMYSTSLLVVSQTGNPGNCQPQTSTQPGDYVLCAGSQATSSGALNDMMIQVGDGRVFEYRFGGNYTLTQANLNSTHTSTASIVGQNDVSPSINTVTTNQSLLNMEFSAREYASLVIPNADRLNLTYRYATMMYRVSYPIWNGLTITSDPELVAYLVARPSKPTVNPPPPTTPPPTTPPPTTPPPSTQTPTNTPNNVWGLGSLNFYYIVTAAAGSILIAAYLLNRRFKLGKTLASRFRGYHG